MMEELRSIAQFKVFAKNHVLFRENAEADRLYLIKEGWIRRVREGSESDGEDFIGNGYLLRHRGHPAQMNMALHGDADGPH